MIYFHLLIHSVSSVFSPSEQEHCGQTVDVVNCISFSRVFEFTLAPFMNSVNIFNKFSLKSTCFGFPSCKNGIQLNWG